MNLQFNHDLYINRLLPSFKRKAKILAYLGLLCFPLKSLYAEFLQMVARLNKEANYNGQVGVLEWLLNERFDTSLRRIKILDSVSFAAPIRAYLQSENKPRLAAYLQSEGLPKMITGEIAEYSAVDFVVQIPNSLNSVQTPISRLVNKYKMGGKSFEIILI